MDDIVKEFFGQQKPQMGAARDSFFEKYGLSLNPFPPNRMIFEEVLYGQEQALSRFISAAREILISEQPQRRALGIVAGTGGGKTHFLRHCEYKFRAVCERTGRLYAITEFTAGSGKLIDLVHDIYRDADKACRERHEADLITAITRTLKEAPHRDQILSSIRMDDLRQCLNTLITVSEGTSQVSTKKVVDFDLLAGIARRWIHAETLTQSERKQLNVFSRLSTASMAIKLLREIFEIARELNVLEGMLLCVDEMESLFKRGLSHAQIQSFLQDLRYLYDESVHGNTGFSLLMLSASTTTGADSLVKVNYPIYQRLGYEGENALTLKEILSVGEAIEFAGSYIDFFHKKWEEERSKKKLSTKPELSPRSLLTATEIQTAFLETSSGSSAPAGSLLDKLHTMVQQKRT